MNFRWFFSVKPFWWKSNSFFVFSFGFYDLRNFSPKYNYSTRGRESKRPRARVCINTFKTINTFRRKSGQKVRCLCGFWDLLPAHSPPFTCTLPPIYLHTPPHLPAYSPLFFRHVFFSCFLDISGLFSLFLLFDENFCLISVRRFSEDRSGETRGERTGKFDKTILICYNKIFVCDQILLSRNIDVKKLFCDV